MSFSDYLSVASILISVSALGFAVFVYRNTETKEKADLLRPYFAQLKHSLETVAEREDETHFAQEVRGITYPLEEMRKSSLDITLRKEAPEVFQTLTALHVRLLELDKICAPYFNSSEGYWKVYPKELAKMGYLRKEREALYVAVVEWLEKNS